MDLNKINLNYYSFGYLGGFIDKFVKKMTLQQLVKLANNYHLGGIEFPADYLFKNNYDQLDDFLQVNNKLNVFISFEAFKPEEIKAFIAILKKNDINRARIKMSNYFGGNRFKINDFYFIEYETFVKNLKLIKSYLIDYDFHLLIENHQDLNSHDILNIIDTISEKCIGVNWDIGNSLPTGETPLQFYKNLKDHIYNIHIKDYQITKNDDAVEYHRCIIGDGNIGINSTLNMILKDNYQYSMSIELGAYEKRVSYIFNEEYWNSYPCYNDNHKTDYINFINSRIKNTENINDNETPSKKLELFQIEQSINNLKDLH